MRQKMVDKTIWGRENGRYFRICGRYGRKKSTLSNAIEIKGQGTVTCSEWMLYLRDVLIINEVLQ